MKLKFILLCASVLAFGVSGAQEMMGFRTDNYNGVNGAFFNPANLGNNHFKVDVNLLGMNIFAGNENIKFNSGTLSDLNDSNGLSKIIGTQPNTILANLALHGPSVLYSINDQTTVAVVSRIRMLFDVRDLDGQLVNSISNQTIGLPVTLNNNTNMRVSTNMFAEFGVSGGHVVYDQGPHFIKVGATLKYLAGVGNYYLQLNKLNATIDTNSNGDAVAKNASGTIAVGGGGLDLSGSGSDIRFDFNGSGFGADLGAVYEYRPGGYDGERNQYLFKASVALLDLGGIKYTAIPKITAGYDINIPAGQQFELNNLETDDNKSLTDAFDEHPNVFKRTAGLNNTSYRVALPRTLQLGGDVRATKNVYVAANLQLAMTNNENKPYNPRAINSVAVTPRYETPMFAAYLPVSYNNLSKMNIGLGLRAGPLYIGTSSLIGSRKQVDFYFGLRFGFKSKKEKQENNATE